MARIKNKDHLLTIKWAAKEFKTSENDIAEFFVEMGFAWCVLGNKSIVECEERIKYFEERVNDCRNCNTIISSSRNSVEYWKQILKLVK